jgi:hypothetical protein
MHPETMKLLARTRQDALLQEARNERLAATAAGGRRTRRSGSGGSSRSWRRFAGSVVIDLGTWLAGGRAEPVSNLRG